jgi:hypothetical protein
METITYFLIGAVLCLYFHFFSNVRIDENPIQGKTIKEIAGNLLLALLATSIVLVIGAFMHFIESLL